MADYIDREELIKAIMNDEMLLDTYGTADRWEETIAKINSMPSVDAVEVVKCKDCKHCDKEWGWCTRLSEIEDGKGIVLIVEPTDYCKWGEKE